MKKLQIIIVCTLIFSMSIGFYLGSLMVPDLPVGTMIAGIIGSVVGVGIVLGTIKFRESRKKHNIPDIDERTYFFY